MSREFVCKAADLAAGKMRQATLPDGNVIAIYNVGGTFYATDDMCTHAESSLSDEGSLQGHIIECAWHFGCFDVRTGEVTASPCTDPLRTYPVSEEDGALYVDLLGVQV